MRTAWSCDRRLNTACFRPWVCFKVLLQRPTRESGLWLIVNSAIGQNHAKQPQKPQKSATARTFNIHTSNFNLWHMREDENTHENTIHTHTHTNTVLQPFAELNTLTFYFIFHWPSPQAENKCLFCLSFSKSGCQSRASWPARVRAQRHLAQTAAVVPRVRLLRGTRRKRGKTQTYIPAEEWISGSARHSSTIEQSEGRERHEERDRKTERARESARKTSHYSSSSNSPLLLLLTCFTSHTYTLSCLSRSRCSPSLQ